MSILCYLTDQIRKDVTTHGISKDDLTKFAASVEKRQSLSGFDHFPPPCLVKKKLFGFKYRMIAAEKLVGDHLVVVFLRLLVRGGNDYSDLQRDPATWVERSFEAEVDDVKLSAWVQQRTDVEPPPLAPLLSETEKAFLWSSAYSDEYDDVMVCETEQWVNQIREPRITPRLIRLPELIVKAIARPAGEVQILRSASDDRLAIMAFNLPSTRQCVLLSVLYSESSDEQLRTDGTHLWLPTTWIPLLGPASANTRRNHLVDRPRRGMSSVSFLSETNKRRYLAHFTPHFVIFESNFRRSHEVRTGYQHITVISVGWAQFRWLFRTGDNAHFTMAYHGIFDGPVDFLDSKPRSSPLGHRSNVTCHAPCFF